MPTRIGFREQSHTADWELEVWAPDLAGLLEQAARGMYALSRLRIEEGARRELKMELKAADAEGLLVRFLTELLWLEQDQHLGFDDFSITVDEDCSMHAVLQGGVIAKLDKEIKAVTYHNLAVEKIPSGLHVCVVFDV